MTRVTDKKLLAGKEETLSEEVLSKIERAFANVQHGTITLIIQDSRIIQLEKNEKIRFI